MSAEPAKGITPGAFRSALDGIVASIEPDGDGSTARGCAIFGPALVGPAGRTHGGAHAFGRTISVLRALGEEERFPLRIELDLRKGIGLDEPVVFTAEREGPVLRTRFSDDGRLDATLSLATAWDADARWAHWQPLLRQTETEEHQEIETRDMLLHVSETLAWFDADPAELKERDHFARALLPGGRCDLIFACMAMDYIGAVGVGLHTQGRLFTTHIMLDLGVSETPPDTRSRFVVDRTSPRDEPGPRTEVDGVPTPPLSLAVAWVDAAHSTLFGEGRITLVPQRGKRVTATGASSATSRST